MLNLFKLYLMYNRTRRFSYFVSKFYFFFNFLIIRKISHITYKVYREDFFYILSSISMFPDR